MMQYTMRYTAIKSNDMILVALMAPAEAGLDVRTPTPRSRRDRFRGGLFGLPCCTEDGDKRWKLRAAWRANASPSSSPRATTSTSCGSVNAGGLYQKAKAVQDGNRIAAVYFEYLPEQFRLLIPAIEGGTA